MCCSFIHKFVLNIKLRNIHGFIFSEWNWLLERLQRVKAWWSLLHCVINVSPAQKMCTDHLLLITQVCTNCSIQSALSLHNYRQTRWKYFPLLSESYNILQQNKFLLWFDAQINIFFIQVKKNQIMYRFLLMKTYQTWYLKNKNTW